MFVQFTITAGGSQLLHDRIEERMHATYTWVPGRRKLFDFGQAQVKATPTFIKPQWTPQIIRYMSANFKIAWTSTVVYLM